MNKIVLFLCMIAVTVSGMAQTVEEKPEVKGETSESLAAVKLANQVLRYGYENKSTLALLDALQIFSENPTQALKATKEGTAVDETKADGKKAKVSFDYESVLADAKAFADGDPNLLALIDNEATLTARLAIMQLSMATATWITQQVLLQTNWQKFSCPVTAILIWTYMFMTRMAIQLPAIRTIVMTAMCVGFLRGQDVTLSVL